ncbi:MAG: 1-acyl-sn-glycerol-3-phosphate acyltransferase [Clostridia bacterium]|nr:1-acyl-sn-glycerol-3-phosphate acyltransferase [Clostridia bacterium]
MKIPVKKCSYEQVKQRTPREQKPAKKPNILFRTLLKLVSLPDIWAVKFRAEKKGMEKLKRGEPCVILMNHCSFLDLEIAQHVFYPRPLNIVTTWDGYVGKNWLMRQIGCIQTKKYSTSPKLLREIKRLLEKGSSVLIYPEAGYSFDGTATTMGDGLGKLIKLYGVPVVTCITDGAYLRQPLYNELKKRKLQVTAEVEYLFSAEEIAKLDYRAINARIEEKFSFDAFRSQQEKGIRIDEPSRADGLNRVLYKCPHCLAEGRMVGLGEKLSCLACGKEYRLTEYGKMEALVGDTEFDHIPDWYRWQRSQVKAELEAGRYEMNLAVEILMMIDSYKLYHIGEGRLKHDENGFLLRSNDGQLDYRQAPTASYTLNSDFYWYQISDTICIGDMSVQYYCLPKTAGDVVAKARLAAEELYKIKTQK